MPAEGVAQAMLKAVELNGPLTWDGLTRVNACANEIEIAPSAHIEASARVFCFRFGRLISTHRPPIFRTLSH